jgi:hypothetical protein
MDPSAYLAEVELVLVSTPVLTEYEVIRWWVNTDDGYIRLRARLVNGDFLEAAEYFVVQTGQIRPQDYRYQWMDAERQILRMRWDSTPHHPNLPGFPHHIHQGSESNVEASLPMGILELLRFLEERLCGR